uniref:Integrase core domain containing protein n=1 Tax=Solanum tuberosum TaxID=4113 RepID=M1DYF4_SOLTU
MLAKVLQKVESTNVEVKEMKSDFSSMSQLVDSHTTSIKSTEQQLGQLPASLNQSKNGSLPSDTIQNPKKDGHCMAIATKRGKILTDPIFAGTKHEQVLEQAGREEDEAEHVDDLEDAHPIAQPPRGKRERGETGLKIAGTGCRHLFTSSLTDRGALHGQLHGTMAPRRKNATKPAPPTTSQSKGHNDSESSSSEVQINVTPEDHPPRATRSRTSRAILQDTPPQSKEGESESGSQEDATTSPPAINTEVETGVREEADAIDKDIEITTNDTMVLYVNIHEPDLAARQQLIDYFRSM